MKVSTPEIVWHGKKPVFSADFHRNGPKWRLATGGADNDVKVSIMHPLFLASLLREYYTHVCRDVYSHPSDVASVRGGGQDQGGIFG